MTGTVRRSRFEPGQRVRLNLPGSKLHGVTGVLKAPRPPAGWWLVVADAELEQPDGEALEGELGRSFIAPDLWLELAASGSMDTSDMEPDAAAMWPDPSAERAAEASLGRIAKLRGRRRS